MMYFFGFFNRNIFFKFQFFESFSYFITRSCPKPFTDLSVSLCASAMIASQKKTRLCLEIIALPKKHAQCLSNPLVTPIYKGKIMENHSFI